VRHCNDFDGCRDETFVRGMEVLHVHGIPSFGVYFENLEPHGLPTVQAPGTPRGLPLQPRGGLVVEKQ
jgi:hypothetical protein